VRASCSTCSWRRSPTTTGPPLARRPKLLRELGLHRIGEAATLLGAKATPGELDAYRAFVVSLAERVAAAHREDGQDVSPAEQAAIDAIRASLGAAAG